MSILTLTTSTSAPVRFEESAGGTRVPLDFHSVAGLIDVVAGNAPARLSTVLTILWETSFKAEMREVLQLVTVCRDPLSALGCLCIDALQTFEDLEKLAKAGHWTSLASCTGNPEPRSRALLNACDHQIARLHKRKLAPYKAIRERLNAASTLECQVRGREIQALAGLRMACCPEIWQLYEKWRDTD